MHDTYHDNKNDLLSYNFILPLLVAHEIILPIFDLHWRPLMHKFMYFVLSFGTTVAICSILFGAVWTGTRMVGNEQRREGRWRGRKYEPEIQRY